MTNDPEKIRLLLEMASSQQVTDIHLVVDRPPVFRIHGNLVSTALPLLTSREIEDLIYPMLNDQQRNVLSETRELDFSYFGLKEFQFRVNAHFEKGNLASTIRISPMKIASPVQLGLPSIVEKLAQQRKGMIIFSGTAGSGKTTTLSCVVDLINNRRQCKIVTIEDPIEYIHQSKQSLIIQREVGSDTQSFAAALKYALRQDPDVVVVGEIRDYESISMAITTAETGHLVITTVHAPDSVETINRIIDVYPAGRREQLYVQLAENITAVIGHTLVPRMDGTGRILATEVLLGTLPIRNLIRRGALLEIRGQLDGDEYAETHSLEKCLSNFVKKGIITPETAFEYARYPDWLDIAEEQAASKKAKTLQKTALEVSTTPIDKKILIVDGNIPEREAMVNALKKKGYQKISEASKGKEGLWQIKMENPDLVVLEASLFDVDSFAVCRHIKQVEKMPIKVIIITGRLHDKDAISAKEAEADAFVVKTTNHELLLKTIDKLFNET